MANEKQIMMLADIRIIKQEQKEQDKRIENLELKESVNGVTILKAISNLEKNSEENFQSIRKELQELRADNKSLHEDNKSIHEELQRMNGKMDLIIELISKKLKQ